MNGLQLQYSFGVQQLCLASTAQSPKVTDLSRRYSQRICAFKQQQFMIWRHRCIWILHWKKCEKHSYKGCEHTLSCASIFAASQFSLITKASYLTAKSTWKWMKHVLYHGRLQGPLQVLLSMIRVLHQCSVQSDSNSSGHDPNSDLLFFTLYLLCNLCYVIFVIFSVGKWWWCSGCDVLLMYFLI